MMKYSEVGAWSCGAQADSPIRRRASSFLPFPPHFFILPSDFCLSQLTARLIVAWLHTNNHPVMQVVGWVLDYSIPKAYTGKNL
jgi:hypothetical protein